MDKEEIRQINEEELYDLAELFKVFGDSTRIRILVHLFETESYYSRSTPIACLAR